MKRLRGGLAGWALATALALLPGLAAAHKPSDSYLTLSVGAKAGIAGQWDIALRDLDFGARTWTPTATARSPGARCAADTPTSPVLRAGST